MALMFWGCSKLNYLNLSSFYTNSKTNLREMFSQYENLENLLCNDERILNEFYNSKIKSLDKNY